MYMIERVTNIRYPKDVVHEPFHHLRDWAKNQRLASMLALLVQLVTVMMCPLHPPHLASPSALWLHDQEGYKEYI
jgi:hypothetical protein